MARRRRKIHPYGLMGEINDELRGCDVIGGFVCLLVLFCLFGLLFG